ncbi:hypothetical protein JAO78_015095 [Alishewanella sp. 16-MA]|uniref:Uncharacterized protein n=1 Tax=Alishewanella maricola TaxID=2795740 RepID=A0ABS8C715_9ALTE|nr:MULTISPECIES: hypothetical protein [Alishewanella]MDP4944228.1 hypothetical protein [Alishewanella sp.]MCB5228134.1 hypothetical protein [Alishewanella maricola]MDP5035220.1 hypothetical protein [Alishewanella sp.]MDP5185590.1 hypothetical protein [Alishewanella sp.]MDP5460371.1 hypothetical protein [Alishewanella sp. SMS8]
MSNEKKPALSNAEKQRRYRDRQKDSGKKELRGYLTPEALKCYEDIVQKTQWNDSTILSNALRLMYAAHKLGQVGILNSWLNEHKR